MPIEIKWEGLEQTARVLGERWARRLRLECHPLADGARPWPGTLEEARRLLDDTLGDKIAGERLEPLALIVERSARAAWHASVVRRTESAPVQK